MQPGKCVGVGAVKTILCLRCHERGDGPPRAWKYNRRLSELGTTCHITSQIDNGKCRTNGQLLTELEVVPSSADVENTKCKHEAWFSEKKIGWTTGGHETMLRQEKYKKQDARQKRRDVITSFRGKIHACLNTVSDRNSYDYITHWIITNTGVFGAVRERVLLIWEVFWSRSVIGGFGCHARSDWPARVRRFQVIKLFSTDERIRR